MECIPACTDIGCADAGSSRRLLPVKISLGLANNSLCPHLASDCAFGLRARIAQGTCESRVVGRTILAAISKFSHHFLDFAHLVSFDTMTAQATSRNVPRLIELVKPAAGRKLPADFKPKLMEHLAQQHKLLSIATDLPRNVSYVGGERSYVLLGSLAKLERALMKWTMNELVRKHNFTPVVVPNILHDNIIERCGFPTQSSRSQVYKISASNEESILDEQSKLSGTENITHSCIAGTSEFALASIHIGDTIPADELPKRYCALSRCYRAETSSTASEWGLYRVKYFNKVEMFAFTMPDKSSEMHEDFLKIQKDLFSQMKLQFQILDMPQDDLGLSATKKYDIEAWMAGRQRFGEISSTSNCENYQSSRLNCKYSQMVERDDQLQIDSDYVHTINGTACSSVRMLIAIFEQHQTEDGRVEIPEVLVPHMNGIRFLPSDDDSRQLINLDLYPEPIR